ncbi:hypothetical protein [Burkholderia alba]|uniref:hypothetical protein n=1 Tax=Burkholderia alba TaxID=2683677 RepID=UPI002B05E526|nr:hypothetical protein [Burkholderia alba]
MNVEIDGSADGWTRAGEYGWSGPKGWAIGRYIAERRETFLLWRPDGRAHDRYSSFEAAQSAFDGLSD